MKGYSTKIDTKLFRGLLACIFLSSFLFPAAPVRASNPAMEFPFFQKGICFATWDKNRLASSYSDQALETLRNIGAEYIQITVTQYQEKCDSTEIKATCLTPSDSSVKHAVKTAHKLGLKVMLKPHLDLIDKNGGTFWRADIGFHNEKDWKKWFKEYQKFITHYAKIAERLDVEIFCVGTELSFSTQKPGHWQKVISSVKNSYTGRLTYAANWDNYKNVEFWQELDFVGINAFFPLTYKSDPTVEDIKKGWEKWKHEIKSWHSKINKPIVFTEIGYSSTPGAPSAPWQKGHHGNADVEIQAKCYAAFFESVWASPWLTGVYWWKYSPSIHGGGKNNRCFTPLNKPAARILEENYGSRGKGRSRPHTT
ncbi:MAG: hypothetical protein KAS86_01435 [Candidatus Omnitrophica bacterium]|nr:hypothetical protein [Candidatus Omnitrophota bacterium]